MIYIAYICFKTGYCKYQIITLYLQVEIGVIVWRYKLPYMGTFSPTTF